MANIDVTELMMDPDFVDPIQIVTRVPYVDFRGQNHIRETILESFGSVQPADFNTIQRLPETLRVANVSSFWFKGNIIASQPGKYSSILIFKGLRYQVQTVADWSNFGRGYSEGTCIVETPT